MHLPDNVATSGVPPLQDVVAGMRLAELEPLLWDEARATLQDRLTALAGRRGPLWRYAKGLTRNDHAADDLLQDALALAYERLPAYGDRETTGDPFKAWACGIVKTCHRQSLKQQGRHPERHMEPEAWATLAVEEEDAFAVSDTADIHALITNAIDTLPPRQQEIARRAAAGLNGAEIARITGDDPAAVRKNLSRAVQKLGVIFNEAGVVPSDYYQPEPAVASISRRPQAKTRKPRASDLNEDD